MDAPKSIRGPILLVATALPLVWGCAGQADQVERRPAAKRVDVPADLRPSWWENRRQTQMTRLAASDVFHGFQFTDRLPESGIRFVNRMTDDSGKTFKSVHYDHGTGLAVADVDGDGLFDIYFVNQVGVNELWRNLGAGKFEDITARAGVGVADKIGVTASFADIDNDGDADLYTTTVRGGNALFENDGTGRFTDISKPSGLGYVGHASGAVFFDYDRDGLVDLFLANVGKYTSDSIRTSFAGAGEPELAPGELEFYDGLDDAFSGHLRPERSERSLLFKNRGDNRFDDVTDAVGLDVVTWSGDASALDGNDDGWPDLYVLNMQGDDEYLQNEQGRRFVPRSREAFPKTPWGSMGIKVFDFDNDGRLDIYITDMHSDMSKTIGPHDEKLKSDMQFPAAFLATEGTSIFGNALFKNEGGGRYADVSDAVGAETYWPWGLSTGDLNADGYEDVFVTGGMSYPYRYGINSALLNQRGAQLLDSEYVLGVEPRRGGQYAKPWFEVDCSGEDEGLEGCKDQTGWLQVWGALSSRSSAIFDLDDDGDLDIVTNDFNAEPMVLLSNLTAAKPTLRFLKVRLTGSRSNRGGLGARVTVTAAGHAYVKVHDGKSGYLSQSLMPLYFGLGDAAIADRVEVVWPSGQRQVVDGPVAAGTLLDVEEPE